jgi:hypothetical protein
MFPASTMGGGNAFAFPDTCKTPSPAGPVPIPYPNIATLNMANAATCTMKVKIMNSAAITKSSIVPLTSGDEAGVAGGVISGQNMGQCAFKMGVSKVKLEGNEAVNMLKPTGQNGSNANAVGMIVAPSQTKVIIVG